MTKECRRLWTYFIAKRKSIGTGSRERLACEDYREVVWVARVTLAKTQTELNLVRAIKWNKKIFYRYLSVMIGKGRCGLLLKGNWKSGVRGKETAEVLNDFFALVFTSTVCSHITQAAETKGKNWRKNIYLL